MRLFRSHGGRTATVFEFEVVPRRDEPTTDTFSILQRGGQSNDTTINLGFIHEKPENEEIANEVIATRKPRVRRPRSMSLRTRRARPGTSSTRWSRTRRSRTGRRSAAKQITSKSKGKFKKECNNQLLRHPREGLVRGATTILGQHPLTTLLGGSSRRHPWRDHVWHLFLPVALQTSAKSRRTTRAEGERHAGRIRWEDSH